MDKNIENVNNEEESIEQIFADFIESIKNLPKEDLDKIYDNLQEMDKNNTNIE